MTLLPKSSQKEGRLLSGLLFFPVLVLSIAGCTETPSNPIDQSHSTPTVVVDYTCDDGESMRIKWQENDVVVLFDSLSWQLARVRSASGARYSDDVKEIWEHQGVV